ncbi:hypothetical protein Tco_0238626 [Tanacetum coccineum]
MKDAISLMGRSEGVFRMTTNKMYQPPPEPSRQEEFEHIMMNFILDQEERVEQLEEYMKVIIGDFMQLSSEVTRRYDPIHLGVRFRLGGEQKEISLLELGWRIGLYSEWQSWESAILSGLRKREIRKWPPLGIQGLRLPIVALQRPLWVERKALIGSPKLTYSTFIASTPMRSSATFHTGLLKALEEDEEDDEGDEADGGGAGNEGAGGSADMYHNMSQGDWQVRQARWMDQQDNVGIKSLLDAVWITATHVCVNVAQLDLVLLRDFKENMLSSYYC